MRLFTAGEFFLAPDLQHFKRSTWEIFSFSAFCCARGECEKEKSDEGIMMNLNVEHTLNREDKELVKLDCRW